MRIRKPKKLEDFPVKTSARAILVPIYFNSHTGEFSADLDGEHFSDYSLPGIRNQLTDAAELTDGEGWKPFICFDLGNTKVADCNSVALDFILVGMKNHDGRTARTMTIEADGSVKYGERTDAWDYEGRLEYTPERLRAITTLKGMVAQTKRMILNVMVGTAQTIEEALDRSNAPAALLARPKDIPPGPQVELIKEGLF